MQSYRGKPSVQLRTRDVSTTAYYFVVEHDTSDPDELPQPHPSEWVSWLAIGTFE